MEQQQQLPLTVGDFVYYRYGKKAEYPGKILAIHGNEYKVEICTNKKKSVGNELEIVESKRSQLRPMLRR